MKNFLYKIIVFEEVAIKPYKFYENFCSTYYLLLENFNILEIIENIIDDENINSIFLTFEKTNIMKNKQEITLIGEELLKNLFHEN